MFKPTPNPPRNPSPMFSISPGINNETLLAHACESLASASVMTNDFAAFLEGSQRNTALAIAQIIMLATMDSVDSGALENLQLKPHIFFALRVLGRQLQPGNNMVCIRRINYGVSILVELIRSLTTVD